MPEKVLKKLNIYILPAWKACFIAAVLAGLLAHSYKICSWLPNWDSLVFRYDAQNMISLGRWFLPVVCSFSSFYDLPFLSGIITIFFHALGSVLICRILSVERKITAGLIGAVIVTFPTVTSVLMYNYVADGYAIAFFLSVLSALFIVKEKPNYLISALLITLSCGIYQAYITVTIMLLLIWLIERVVFHKAAFMDILKKSSLMLVTGISGVALYAIILKIILAANSAKLLDYQGASEAASFSGFDFYSSLYTIKETFIGCFFDLSEGLNVFIVLNVFVLLFTAVYYLLSFIKNKLYKNPANILMIAVLCVLLLFGAAALAFINPGVDYHNLMLMGYSVFYLFFLLIYEKSMEKDQKNRAVKCWIVLIASLIIIANQIVIANVSYHKAQIAYEKSYGVLLRIADRIEETPKSDECDRILVIGALDDSHAYSVNLTPDITGITDGYIIRADDETVGQSVLCSALNDYCGKNYSFISGDEKKAFIAKDEVKSMNLWPKDNCIKVINDAIVIKLGMEDENS